MSWLSFAFAFVAGAFITIQAGSNSQLKKSLGVPMPALIVNYLLGISCIALYMLLKREPVPAMERAAEAPWWSWTGGMFGALYGVAAVLLARPDGSGHSDRARCHWPTDLLSAAGSFRLGGI